VDHYFTQGGTIALAIQKPAQRAGFALSIHAFVARAIGQQDSHIAADN
jgi:hypothetical protein